MIFGIVIALIAQIFLGGSLVVDKILLKERKSIHVLPYAFWIGILDLLGLLLIPFGFRIPAIHTVGISFIAGIAFFFSILAYYKALSAGEVSETLAIVGGFAPIATYILSSILIPAPLNIGESIAFAFLTGGGFLLFASEKVPWRKVLPWILLAAILIGLADTFTKLTFADTNFITAFVLMKIATALTALSFLAIPRWRKEIFSSSLHAPQKYRIAYVTNRAVAGFASVLIFYALKLDHPALIEAINGSRYVVIFIFAFLITQFRPRWLKETFRGFRLWAKIVATILIMIGLTGLGAERYYENIPAIPPNEITWGVTYSELMAKHLGLDSRAALTAIINELHPKALRLIAYWDMIEPQKGAWDFAYLDSQFSQAASAHIPVILVVGQKAPRWPECHYPNWIKFSNSNFSTEGGSTSGGQFSHAETKTQFNQELLNYIQHVIDHYRENPWLNMWQVENEPFLNFGVCPPPDTVFLDKEIALVRSLDPNHKIFETDGGEFGNWYQAASRADVFGPTLYRTVENRFFGHITYPITPEFYGLRISINKWLTGKADQKYAISELGLEPWTVKQIYEIPVSQQLSLFPPQTFDETMQFARAAHFDTYYLWGAEWWYSLKLQGNAIYWNKAKAVIASGL